MLNTQQYPAALRCCSSGVASGSYKANGLNGCSNAEDAPIITYARRWRRPSSSALFLLTQTVQKSDDFDRLQDVILAINLAGGCSVIACLLATCARLLREYRTNVPGAKLKARMVGMFVGLAVSAAAGRFLFLDTVH